MCFKIRLFNVVKKIDFEKIKTRTHDFQRHKKKYIVFESNFVWSIDEYCKLNDWNLKIYANINVYSRHVIWIYVDINVKTIVNVKNQYVNIMKQNKMFSQFIRFDHDIEIILMIDSQYRLSQMTRTTNSKKKIKFNECYLFETNIFNQRIKSWWKQLCKNQLNFWKINFLFFLCVHNLLIWKN